MQEGGEKMRRRAGDLRRRVGDANRRRRSILRLLTCPATCTARINQHKDDAECNRDEATELEPLAEHCDRAAISMGKGCASYSPISASGRTNARGQPQCRDLCSVTEAKHTAAKTTAARMTVPRYADHHAAAPLPGEAGHATQEPSSCMNHPSAHDAHIYEAGR